MSNNKIELLSKLDVIYNPILKGFEKKQDLTFEFWVGDEIGGVACFDTYIFGLDDIIFDLKTNQPKDLIKEWFDCLSSENNINYQCYSKGLRNRE